MRVAAQQLDVEPDVQHAFEPECDLWPAVGEEAGAFPETAVGAEQLGVAADDLLEVRAGDLLLALDDPADRHRRDIQRADRRQPHRELGLVVGRAARVEPPVAHRRLERRGLPELDRVDRLDVVVVVEQQRPRARAAKLPVDRRRRAVDAELTGLEAGTREQLLDQVGRLAQRASSAETLGCRHSAASSCSASRSIAATSRTGIGGGSLLRRSRSTARGATGR